VPVPKIGDFYSRGRGFSGAVAGCGGGRSEAKGKWGWGGVGLRPPFYQVLDKARVEFRGASCFFPIEI